jgi:radical SAM protein with 4Fe4S-binding SPASM domain
MASSTAPLVCADNLSDPFVIYPDPRVSSRTRFVILHLNSPRWFITNRTGLEIYSILHRGGTVEAAEQCLCERYAVDKAVAVRDVRAVAGQMGKLVDRPKADRRTPRLKGLFLHLTRRCNLECAHCYVGAGRSSDSLPLELVRSLIDQLSLAGGEALALSGGEPLCYPELESVIRQACARLPKVKLLTNGTLGDPGLAGRVAHPNLEVHVSVDGAQAEQHDQLRGTGAFELTMRGLSTWIETLGPERVSISATVTGTNVGELHRMVGFARSLGVSRLRFLPLRAVGRGESLEGRPGLSEYLAFMQRVAAEKAGDPSFIITYGVTGFLFEVPVRSTGEIWCPVGEQIVIDTNGDAYPCVLLMRPEFRVGNAKETRLDGLMASAVMGECCRTLVKRPSQLTECAACAWRSLCQSGCMGQALDENGDIWSRDPYCEYRRSAYPKAFDELLKSLE